MTFKSSISAAAYLKNDLVAFKVTLNQSNDNENRKLGTASQQKLKQADGTKQGFQAKERKSRSAENKQI